MRIFVALDIEPEIGTRIWNFVEQVRALAPDARWVKPESLHVTLKFIGEKPDGVMKQVEAPLGQVKAPPIELAFRGCGFFPTPKAARVFWVGIESQDLAQLAKAVEDALAAVQIPREERAYSPHLTLARAAGGSGTPAWRKGDRPNRQFAKLQQELTKSRPPDFGTMTAHEFFLYRSELQHGGARYTKIACFPLPFAR